MALHGTIMVNGEAIGYWEAQRQQAEVPADGISRYNCTVELYQRGTPRTFAVDHRYDDGAVALVAKLLAECWEFYAQSVPEAPTDQLAERRSRPATTDGGA